MGCTGATLVLGNARWDDPGNARLDQLAKRDQTNARTMPLQAAAAAAAC